MSRHPHEPTPQTRAEVSALKSFGVPLEDISAYIGIDRKTLSKHYKAEIDKAQTKANAAVGNFLYGAASGRALKDGATHSDCVRAAMFWAKTRMQWRETNHVEHTSPDGSMTPKPALDMSKLSTAALEEIAKAANDTNDQ
jgi:hypothetical protein